MLTIENRDMISHRLVAKIPLESDFAWNKDGKSLAWVPIEQPEAIIIADISDLGKRGQSRILERPTL